MPLEVVLNSGFQMPPIIKRLLEVRGLHTDVEIEKFLAPSLKDLTDPLKIDGMDKALNRLRLAWEKQENICVYGDYDLDGNSGIALLVSAFDGLGFDNVSFYQPSRFTEGYGIHKEALKKIYDRGDRLVVSVDCGITAVDEAIYAKELGLDLIITDHHLPREILPNCVALLNPNKGTCESGLGHLCGVGVGFYLIMALKRELGVTFDLKNLLDLYSIGTVTDLVPLIKENRILLKHGLKVLSETQRPGLQALVAALELTNRELDAQDIAFSIGPKLNALARLERGLRPLDILMADDIVKAGPMAREVLKLNEERKKIQEELQEKIIEQLTAEELENPAIVLKAPGHAGVVGLAATKASELSGKPSFIVAITDTEMAGSARGREEDGLPDAMAFANTKFPGCLKRFGGHAQAAGFSVEPDGFENFKAGVLEYYNLKNAALSVGLAGSGTLASKGAWKYDVEASIEEFDETMMGWLAQLGPYGTSNILPIFLIKRPLVVKHQWLKDVHLKMQFRTKNGLVEGISFFAKNRLEYFTKSKTKEFNLSGEDHSFLVEPSWNYWQGSKRLQLFIRDLKLES